MQRLTFACALMLAACGGADNGGDAPPLEAVQMQDAQAGTDADAGSMGGDAQAADAGRLPQEAAADAPHVRPEASTPEAATIEQPEASTPEAAPAGPQSGVCTIPPAEGAPYAQFPCPPAGEPWPYISIQWWPVAAWSTVAGSCGTNTTLQGTACPVGDACSVTLQESNALKSYDGTCR